MDKVKFLWGAGELIIANPTPAIEKWLHYWHKSLEYDFKTRQRRSRQEKIQLFTVLCERPRIIKTFQGFLNDLIAVCEPGQFLFEDRRTFFPKPDFSKIVGFRLNQEQLFRLFHSHERSGILSAPCRYGKSVMIKNTIRVFPGLKTVVAAPGVDLLNQTIADLKKAFPGREVAGIFSGAKGKKTQSDDITVTSLDSLSKLDKEGTKLVLVDEPHAAVTESRAPELAAFRNARIYGFGATTSGRYDGSDKLITGIIGPILAKRTFEESVKEGATCPIVIYAVRLAFDPFPCRDRGDAYRQLVYESESFNTLVKDIADNHIPADAQTIVFADECQQIALMQLFVQDGIPAVGKKLKPAERRALFDAMVRNEIKRTIATQIFETGVTFPELRVLINATAGGANISSVQRAGRLAEIRPNKERGYMIEFSWQANGYEDAEALSELDRNGNAWTWVVKDSQARLDAYKAMGYEIQFVDDLNQINIK